jgi:CheY-like chemotaxis protein
MPAIADAAPEALGLGESTTEPATRLALLADANSRSAGLAHQMLINAGFNTVVCADGATVIRKANMLQPAVLVLDPGLQGIHGLEILARLKRERVPVPVVLTTRDGQFREDYVVTTYPRLVYLPKPYDRRELIDAVEECLREPKAAPAALGPDDGFVRAIADGPTIGVLRTPVLEVGVCARGRFCDTFFRLLPIDEHRSGLFVAEREAGPEDTGRAFRKLGLALDEAVGRGSPPEDVLRRADRRLRDAAPGMLLAALSLELDSGSNELVLGRAGFHAPLAASPGGSPAEIHLPFGPLLGASPAGGPSQQIRTVRIPFPQDGALLLRSTGALLAVSQQIPDLGQRLFSGYLRQHAGSPTSAAMEALLGLLGALGVQGPGRDLLLLVVRRRWNTGRKLHSSAS